MIIYKIKRIPPKPRFVGYAQIYTVYTVADPNPIGLLVSFESLPHVLAGVLGGQVCCGSGEGAFVGGCFGRDHLGGVLEFLVCCLYVYTAIADTASQTGVWIMAEQHSQWGRIQSFYFDSASHSWPCL